MTMRILDLFCCEGGVSMGLHHAFPEAEIVGVDIKPQPRYPFKFVQADVMMTYFDALCGFTIARHPAHEALGHFDFVWASPPCQKFSMGTHWIRGKQAVKEHPDYIAKIRSRFQPLAVPWVIENVPQAPLNTTLMLCGSMFGLRCAKGYLCRHRIFEANFPIAQPPCNHQGMAVSVSGHGAGGMFGYRKANAAEARELLGMPWATREGVREAIPPAYSEYIGRQFLLGQSAVAAGVRAGA